MAKRAFITGASEGIGAALAKNLAGRGYQITGIARNEEKLKNLLQELAGDGHKFIVADLSTRAGQDKAVDAISSDHYDILINNAGVGTSGAFTDVPVEKQLAMVHLNCEAVVKLSHAYLRTTKAGDAMMNVSSTLAFLPAPGLGLYCATKSFVTAFTESLWFEQKKRDVFVLGLHPGITSTNFQVNAGGKAEDLPKGMAQTPEQVAKYAIEALHERRQPTIISGARNFIFAGLSRLMPRKSTVSLMGNMMKQ
jgi:short-subunit dehydrogenase